MKAQWQNPFFVATAVLLALFVDAAIETWLSGSPVHGWVVAGAGAQVLLIVICGRSGNWRAASVISAALLAATLALTTWLPGGVESGIKLAGSQGRLACAVILLPIVFLLVLVTFRAPRLRMSWDRLVAAVAAVAVVLSGLPQDLRSTATGHATRLAAAPASPPEITSQAERVAALENDLRSIEDGLRESPRDRWDPDYLVQQIGTDPQHLFEWVRDNTFWIPYRGVLRGPAGVLNDRLGNSLDRAVLLATLLQKAGHNVRLAHRELGFQQGLDLATWAMAGSAPVEAPLEDIGFEGPVADADAQERTLDTLIAGLDAQVANQTQRLLGSIGASTADEDWYRRFTAAMTAVRDHWWVQRQDGQIWVDLDMLAAEQMQTGTAATAPETSTLAELAPLHHELTVRVVAERFSGGKTTEQLAMEHAWRPSETIGQPVVLQFWPSDWRSDDVAAATDAQEGFRAMALDQRQWDLALVIGDAVVANASLAASGDLVRPQKGGPFGSIAGNFGRSPSGDDDALVAVWLEYEIRFPGEPPRRIRREVFDLLGPAARSAKALSFTLNDSLRLTRSLSLMMRTEILPINCALASEYVAHLSARSLLADRELLVAAAQGEITPGDAQTKRLLDESKPGFTPLYTLALARLEWSRYAEQIFIDRLNVLARHRFLAATRDGLVVREATDIVANEVGVELAVLDAFALRVEQGVLDTNAERLLQAAGRPIGSTAAAYDVSTNWITLRAGDSPDALKISADARRSISDDLDAGFLVVASRAPVDIGSQPFVGWWRVDGLTGDTLGVAANGWGQDMAERGALYSVFNDMAPRFVFDYLLCQAIPMVAEAARPMVTDFFGTPSWVTPPARQQSSRELYEANKSGCLISAIASGAAFATLPLLLGTLRYAVRGLARPLAGALRFPLWAPKPRGIPRPPKVRLPCLK